METRYEFVVTNVVCGSAVNAVTLNWEITYTMKIRIKPREDTSLEAKIMREVSKFTPISEYQLKVWLIEAADEIYSLKNVIGEMDDIVMRLETRNSELQRDLNRFTESTYEN